MSKSGEIRDDEKCFEFNLRDDSLNKTDQIITYECNGQGLNQFWVYENEQIKHQTKYCIEISRNREKLLMTDCDLKNPNQIWKWQKRYAA